MLADKARKLLAELHRMPIAWNRSDAEFLEDIDFTLNIPGGSLTRKGAERLIEIYEREIECSTPSTQKLPG